MTDKEQLEVKALIERTVADAAKVTAHLESRIRLLQADIERKDRALEGFIAENEALKSELGGRRPERRAPPRETAAAAIERWKTLTQRT
jgi:hypothetical protein